VLPDPEWQLLNQTTLQHYYYSWNAESAAIAFGFGSFYNHSATPNAQFLRRFAEQVMEYVAVMDIEAGEEITITYGCPLWFEPA
jgi:SET domain-containing protein